MINGENGGVAKPTPPPTLPKSYTPSAAAAYRLASMERLAQRQRIFEQGGPPPPPPGADDHLQHQSPATVGGTPPPPPVTAPKPVLGTKASHPFFYLFCNYPPYVERGEEGRGRVEQTGNGRRNVLAVYYRGAPGQIKMSIIAPLDADCPYFLPVGRLENLRSQIFYHPYRVVRFPRPAVRLSPSNVCFVGAKHFWRAGGRADGAVPKPLDKPANSFDKTACNNNDNILTVCNDYDYYHR